MSAGKLDKLFVIYGKAQAVFKPALTGVRAFGNIVAPAAAATLKAAPLVRVIVTFGSLICGTREGVKLARSLGEYSGRVKVIPVAMILSKFADLFDLVTQVTAAAALHIQGAAGVVQSLNIATAVFGTMTAAFGALIVGVLSVDLHATRREIHALKSHIKTESYDAAEKIMTEERSKMSGLRKLFHPLTPKQREKIKSIFDQIGKENNTEKLSVMEKVLHRYKQLRGMKAIGIAIAILTIVGMLVVAFTPTPAAALVWGVVGVAVFTGLSQALAAYIMKRRFEKYLETIENKSRMTLAGAQHLNETIQFSDSGKRSSNSEQTIKKDHTPHQNENALTIQQFLDSIKQKNSLSIPVIITTKRGRVMRCKYFGADSEDPPVNFYVRENGKEKVRKIKMKQIKSIEIIPKFKAIGLMKQEDKDKFKQLGLEINSKGEIRLPKGFTSKMEINENGRWLDVFGNDKKPIVSIYEDRSRQQVQFEVFWKEEKVQ